MRGKYLGLFRIRWKRGFDRKSLSASPRDREFEAVLGHSVLFRSSPLTPRERGEMLDAFLSVCEWVRVFYLWRPNLPDEGDNHLIELAVAGAARTLVTQNVRDVRGGELRFPQLRIETPAEFMTRWRKDYGDDDDSTT